MVYQDTTRSDYASLRITPTWFGERYVRGTTHLQIAVQLPKSVKPDDVLHQGLNFTKKATTDQGAMVGWDLPNVRLTAAHEVAVSFPKRDLQRVIRQTAIDLLVKWFRGSTEARLVLGMVFLALLGVLFFRFTGGTGLSVFAVLAVAACVLFCFSPGWHLISLPAVVVLIGLNEWLLGRRKTHYMPPMAQVEGGGIKRGLTAPEAAVLLELPVAKVLSLVIFGMLKKGILRQVQADPLQVAVNEPFVVPENVARPPSAVQEPPAQPGAAVPQGAVPQGAVPTGAVPQAAADFYGEAAVKQGAVLSGYQRPFLFLIQKNPAKPVRDIGFSLPVKMLITDTAARMKGFDLAETKDYYRAIIRKAVEQASAIGDIPQREQTIRPQLRVDPDGRSFSHGVHVRPAVLPGLDPRLDGFHAFDARRFAGRAGHRREHVVWRRGLEFRRLGGEHDGQDGVGHLARGAQPAPPRRRIPRPQRGRSRGGRFLPGPGRIGHQRRGRGRGRRRLRRALAPAALALPCAGGGR